MAKQPKQAPADPGDSQNEGFHTSGYMPGEEFGYGIAGEGNLVLRAAGAYDGTHFGKAI